MCVAEAAVTVTQPVILVEVERGRGGVGGWIKTMMITAGDRQRGRKKEQRQKEGQKERINER